MVNKILELYHYLDTAFDSEGKGNYIIIQKIQECSKNILASDYDEGFKSFISEIDEKCSYILERKDDFFSHEMKNQYLHYIYSSLNQFETDIQKDSQSMMQGLAEALNLQVIDLSKH